MRFSENRKIAWCVLFICIFVSIFAMGGMCLVKERNRVLELFDAGADTSLSIRHSVDAYLDAARDSVQIMVSEAEKHSLNSSLTEQANTLAVSVGNGEDIGEQYQAYSDLKTKVDQLYNAMYDAVTDDEFVNFKIAYDDFWGYEDMIARDEYHKAARGYNKMTNVFPGNIVSAVFGLEELNTFGG